MKYYLGYYNNHEYKPIRGENIGNTLVQVVSYTTSFTSIKKIKEDLYNRGLIPSTAVRIDYIIEKGPKNNKYYRPLNSTDKIYTIEEKKFFDVTSLKEVISGEINNAEFIALLSAKYIKKYGYISKIVNYLFNLYAEDLKALLEDMRKIALSNETRAEIEEILNFLNAESCQPNYDLLDSRLTELVEMIKKNPFDITNSYIFFKKYIQYKNIPAMSYLSKWLQITIDQSNSGISYTDSQEDVITKESALNSFFNEIVYDYDYIRREYKMENGKRKINYREMFDLGVFVEDYFCSLYNEYVESVKNSSNAVVPEEIEEDDEEEFLEEEDFERMGASPEDYGYNLRRRDG